MFTDGSRLWYITINNYNNEQVEILYTSIPIGKNVNKYNKTILLIKSIKYSWTQYYNN